MLVRVGNGGRPPGWVEWVWAESGSVSLPPVEGKKGVVGAAALFAQDVSARGVPGCRNDRGV